MREPLFVLNFLGQGTRRNPAPDYFRGYFLEYRPEKWVAPVSGGSLKYIDENDKHYDLVISHSREAGISLAYAAGEGSEGVYFVSVGEPAKLSEIIDVGVDEFVPLGSFVTPKQAWVVVEQFLKNPTKLPCAEFMRDIEDTDWPEIEY